MAHVRAHGALFALATLGLLVAVTPARADVKACIAASESGQRARAAGKLREAQAQFLVCGDPACPALVRRDCQQWKGEVGQILPSVVVAARDRQGKDLFDVTVTVDGEPFATKLDGKAAPIDPGKHVFRFEAAGNQPATETVLVREGEHARSVTITFEPLESAKPATAPPAPTAPPPPPEKVRTHGLAPWVVAGVGAAGLVAGVILVATASRPDNCSGDTKLCMPTNGESAAQLDQDKSDAHSADNRRTAGFVVGAIGLGALAGGLVWHFLEPVGPKATKAGLDLAPWTSGKSSGFALSGSF